MENNPNKNNGKNFENENTSEENTQNQSPEEKTTKPNFLKELIDWVETFAFALCFVVLLFTFGFRIVTVDGHSMENTLHHGERLIVSNLFYKPEIGDVIITAVPEYYGDSPLVKRIIATEGQVVDIDFENWVVTVDGKPLALDANGNPTNEPYVNYIEGAEMQRSPNYQNPIVYPYKVPEDCVFVMGDNRNNSSDSRKFGAVNKRHIIGKVYFRITPFDRIGVIESVSPAWN